MTTRHKGSMNSYRPQSFATTAFVFNINIVKCGFKRTGFRGVFLDKQAFLQFRPSQLNFPQAGSWKETKDLKGDGMSMCTQREFKDLEEKK